MASRINTRFLFLLLTITGVVVVAVGGIAFLALKSDPTRNIRRGDELYAAGEYEQAKQEYWRAINKDRSNLEFMRKLQDALERVRPATMDNANSLYGEWLSVMRLRVEAAAHDVTHHLAFLEEVYSNSRLLPSWNTQLSTGASAALGRVPTNSPGYERLTFFRLYADANRLDTLNAGQIDQLEDDFASFLEKHPRYGEGWAALIALHRDLWQREALSRNVTAATERQAILLRTIDQAMQAAGESLPVRIRRTDALLSLARQGARPLQPGESEALLGDLRASLAGATNPIDVYDGVVVMRELGTPQSLQAALEVLTEATQAHRDSPLLQWMLVWNLYDSGDQERMSRQAQALMESEPMPVSFMATYRFELRFRVARLLFQVEADRAASLTGDERAAQLAKAEQVRQRLASLAPGGEQNPLVTECDAWLALLRNDTAVAAAKFTEALKLNPSPDVRTLLAAASALRAQNAPGEARSLMARAREMAPRSAAILVDLASLDLMLGDFRAAADNAAAALQIDSSNTQAAALLAEAQRGLGQPVAPQDPLLAALERASEALREGRSDAARSILVELSEAHPDHWGVLEYLVNVEVEMGLIDEARQRVRAAVDRHPENEGLRTMLAVLQADDPIERTRILLAQRISGEDELHGAMFVAMRRAEQQQRTIARQRTAAGDTAGAAAATALADRMKAEGDRAGEVAQSRGVKSAEYIEARFRDALIARDWSAAEALVRTARETNADQARGHLFQAQLDFERGDYAAAARSLIDATQVKPYAAPAWRLLGMTYQRLGNVADARTAYQRAMDIQPGDATTIRFYAQLLLETGQQPAALQLLRRAADLRVADAEIAEVRLNLEGEVGDREYAIDQRRRRYESNPDDVTNVLRLASLLGLSTPDRAAILLPDGRPRYSEREWSAMAPAAREAALAALRAQRRTEADRLMEEVSAKNPDSLSIAAAHAAYFRDTGRADQARARMARHLAERGKEDVTPLSYVQAAEMFLSLGDRMEALAWLQRGEKYQGDTGLIDEAMAGVFTSAQQWDTAIEYFEKVLANRPSRQIELSVVECLIQLRRFADAEARIATVARTYGESTRLEMLRARLNGNQAAIAASEGKAQDAERLRREQRRAIDRAAAMAPGDPWPLVLRAEAILQEFHQTGRTRQGLVDDALRELSAASEKQAGFLPALQLRVDALLMRDPPDMAGAIQELTGLLRLTPRDPAIRQRAIQIAIAAGNEPKAVEFAQEGNRLEPDRVEWHLALADLASRQQKHAEAASWYASGYRVSKAPALLESACLAMLRLNTAEAAREVLRIIGAEPEALRSYPPLHTVLARAATALGDLPGAERHMRTAYEQYLATYRAGGDHRILTSWFDAARAIYGSNPGKIGEIVSSVSGEAVSAGELYLLSEVLLRIPNQIDAAADAIRRAAERVDSSQSELRFLVAINLGLVRYLKGNYAESRDHYIEALRLAPKDHPFRVKVLNDLAYVYSQHLGEHEKARPLAEEAVSLMPDDASIVDTLGTVYLGLRMLDQAEAQLRRSIELRESASNHLHMGQLLLARGRRSEAEQYLVRGRDLGNDPKSVAEIERILKEMGRTP